MDHKPKHENATRPLASAIHPSTVYQCESPEQAFALLTGATPGYVYSRDGHPNADELASRCAEWHGAARATVTGSGMAALALALLSHCRQGDHVLVSNLLYGRSTSLFTEESSRIGLSSTTVDMTDLPAVRDAMTDQTRLVVVETIANPTLRVADIAALAELAHARGAKLLVDNTFASPLVCRPLALGADLVVESLTKIMNGHSDVMLGMLCGDESEWKCIPDTQSIWGFFASPWDCWLAARGLATLPLRIERATDNARQIAVWLGGRREVVSVQYPGLAEHPDHETAVRQFGGRFGYVVTFTLQGSMAAARQFISAARRIPFCPSLGEFRTTLTHPASTSHRQYAAQEQAELGIGEGTIRLSLGVESAEEIVAGLAEGLSVGS